MSQSMFNGGDKGNTLMFRERGCFDRSTPTPVKHKFITNAFCQMLDGRVEVASS